MTLQDEYHNQWNPKASAGDLEHFISKFECRVEDSREYNQYTRQVSSYHRDFYDSDNYKMETEIVPMKAIHLTSQNLAKLVAEQEHMQRLSDDAEYGKKLWVGQLADNAVREANPAVAKAYRNYQMLLELARK
jgi:hypothetical protein